MAHPQVLEAAVITVPHPTWVERPLACVVPKPEHGSSLRATDILEFLRPRVAKFWLPDTVMFLEVERQRQASASSIRKSYGSASRTGNRKREGQQVAGRAGRGVGLASPMSLLYFLECLGQEP
jgi:acyl-CoA synthetase (AMP-forming)/AMP-acid ligase II